MRRCRTGRGSRLPRRRGWSAKPRAAGLERTGMRTIAHISDLHFGRVDPPVVEGLAADLARRKPTLLVVSGDFTQRARRKQYEQAAGFLKRLPGPQLVVPGNHDIPMFDIIRRFF